MTAYNFRAIQLDLARQMETVDQIRRFIDFAAAHHYTTLFLYLEGRVRTRTFALPSEQSYSLEDIRRVTEYATQAGLESMLATATLAHAEHFFQTPRLRHLAEERDGKGSTRFGTERCETFCPSTPAVYDFWRAYLQELLPAFPSAHLHVGCDEAFNLGYCPLCRERLRREGLQGLFVEHLKKVQALCGDLGKRMWIWDDMFELFPAALAAVPRDIVLCYWMYEPQIEPEGGQAHFANRRRRDFLAEYARLGFDSVFCPASYETANVENLTRYAARSRPLGGLLTQWEMQQVDLADYAPTVAFAGELWAGAALDPAAAWQRTVEKLLPELPAAGAAAVKVLCNGTRKTPPPISGWVTGTLTSAELTQREATRLALETLRPWLPAALPPGPAIDAARVLSELAGSARLRLVYWDLQELAWRVLDPRRTAADTAELQPRAAAVLAELAALATAAAPLPELRRAGMFPAGGLPAFLATLQADATALFAHLESPLPADAGCVVLRLALPDFFGVPRAQVELELGGCWVPIFAGKLKAPDTRGTPHFTARIPCRLAGAGGPVAPTALRFTGWGYGGIGLAFVEVQAAARRWLPAAVRSQTGSLSAAEAVLIDDSQYAYLGARDYAAAMLDPAVAEQRGTVEITLQAE